MSVLESKRLIYKAWPKILPSYRSDHSSIPEERNVW
jgi:hypothetical protein